MNREVVVLSDVAAMSQEMAGRFVRLAGEALQARGRVSVCMSGGNTPKSLYALLASDTYRNQVEWGRVHFFWGDERSVAPDHPDSNYHMANVGLLSKIAVPSGNVHRMPADAPDLPAAAQAYEGDLRQFFGTTPQFDIMLLGMGPDGHTASLFPGSDALREASRWVVPNRVDKLDTWRMTLTYPVINHSRGIYFLVGGADKAEVLKEVLEGAGASKYPCQAVQPIDGSLVWLLDTAAASRLTTVSEQ